MRSRPCRSRSPPKHANLPNPKGSVLKSYCCRRRQRQVSTFGTGLEICERGAMSCGPPKPGRANREAGWAVHSFAQATSIGAWLVDLATRWTKGIRTKAGNAKRPDAVVFH